jgi:YD repeat-containing protein
MAARLRFELFQLSQRLAFAVLVVFSCWALGQAQSTTYHLHRESSTTANLFQLKTANPDATSLAIQTTNLKNKATGEYLIKAFDTQSGVPNAAGVITAGSTITFSVWMKTTAASGSMVPRVKLNLNSATGASLCVINGATALTTTLTKYTLAATVPADVTLTTSDRFYIWVGVNLTATPGANNQGELDVEGSLNGNYDSTVVIPVPPPTPSITGLTPNSGTAGTSVTVAGSNFGATQGTSTVQFNGTTASPTTWSATSIAVNVPAGATSGNVVVTVNGQASNGVNFTVNSSGTVAGTIRNAANNNPISGALVEALQSAVVKGSATTTANGGYSIAGLQAGTYDIRVSASGYQTKLQSGITVTTGNTTSFDQTLDIALATGDIDYIYDELGRLVAVVTAQEFTRYTYDAVGNLLSISKGSPAQVAIIQFTPSHGSVGTTVTIDGTGFSATANQNSVSFNGVAASVTSATTTRLVTSVPSGATTGPVSVTSPNGTAASSTSFVVHASAAPVITGFTPTIGPAGTSVTITGSNFQSAFYNNRVEFNSTIAPITAATSTSITATVPSSATSGRISVETADGIGTSSNDFNVVPAPYTASDIEVIGRMNIGESRLVTITQANKVALILFDGVAGQRVNIGMSGVTFGAPNCCDTAALTWFRPGGVLLPAFGFGPAGNGTSTMTLPTTGTYSMLVDPSNTNTGSVTLTLYEEVPVPITINGAPVTLNFGSGQNGRLTFTGTAGQRVSLGLSGITISPGYCCDVGTIAFYRSDGSTVLAPVAFTNAGAGTPSVVLPANGTYSIVIDPYQGRSGAVTASLSADLSPPISVNGASVPLDFRTGQNAWLMFDGVAGQRVTVGLSAITVSTGYCCDIGAITLYKPDGTVLQAAMAFTNQGFGTPSVVLPASGTYAVAIDPYLGRNGAITATVSADLSPPVSLNGGAVVLDFRPGQNAWLMFDGTAGQRVTLGLSGITIAPGYCCDIGAVMLYKPDGTVLQAAMAFTNQGAGTASVVLPASGTYAFAVDPYLGRNGAITATVSADLSPPITINGPSVVLDFSAGQNAWLTFDGTAGQRISVGLSAISMAPGYCCDIGAVSLYKSDGTVLQAPLAFTNQGAGTASVVLPVSGSYSIFIDPYIGRSGLITATLSADLSPPVSINSGALALDIRPGQNAWLMFAGTAGQRVTLGLSGITIAPGYCCDIGAITLYKPDGTVLQAPLAFTNQGAGTASVVLPVSGTYAFAVDPYLGRSGAITATVSGDLSPPISINGPSVVLDFNAGQNAWLMFDGTAGQRVSVGLSGITMAPGYCCDIGSVSLYKPDGTVLQVPLAFTNQGAGTASVVLPVSGTYAFYIDPYLGRSGAITATVSADLSPPVSINGAPVTLDFRPGQNAWLMFDGTAGQRVSVGLSGVTIAPGYCCDIGSVSLYKPDGTVLQAPLAFTNQGAGTASVVLPVSGTYAFLIDVYLGRSGAMTAAVSADLSPPMSINGAPATLDFRSGQNAWLMFDGTAGQRVSLGLNGLTIAPGYCCDVGSVSLYKPDGTVLQAPLAFTNQGAGTASVALPVSGTYAFLVDVYIGRSGAMTAAVSADLSPPISINGPSVPLDFRSGQNAWLTFDGTAGQRVSIGLSGSAIAPGYCCDIGSISVYKPDGTVLQSPIAFTNNGLATASLVLPVSGTYTIAIDIYIGRSGAITATLSQDLAPVITVNAGATLLTFRTGQNGLPTFTGTLNQQVTVRITGNNLGSVNVKLLKPDGTQLTAVNSSAASFNLTTQTLPVAGTYTISIDPSAPVAGSLSLTIDP